MPEKKTILIFTQTNTEPACIYINFFSIVYLPSGEYIFITAHSPYTGGMGKSGVLRDPPPHRRVLMYIFFATLPPPPRPKYDLISPHRRVSYTLANLDVSRLRVRLFGSRLSRTGLGFISIAYTHICTYNPPVNVYVSWQTYCNFPLNDIRDNSNGQISYLH